MTKKYYVVGYGALNWDDNRAVPKIPLPGQETSGKILEGTPGGSAANTIFGLSKLDVSTAFVGAVGNDGLGTELIKSLEDEGVKSLVNVKDGHSGQCIVLLDNEGERGICVFPEVNDRISIDELSAETLDIIRNAEYFFSSSFACENYYDSLMTQLELARTAKKFCFSPGNLYTNPEGKIRLEQGNIIEDLIHETDILFLNKDEIGMLTGEESYISSSRTLMDNYDIDIIAVTLGREGCLVRTRDDVVDMCAYKPSVIKDTTGVGDAFAAGFMYGLVKGSEPGLCGKMGNYVASRCIEKTGARDGLPYSIILA